MEFCQPRCSVYIVGTGSIGSTAFGLSIGVSVPSQQMSCLENELAIRLLQCISRDMTPTSAGLALYSQTQLALCHADGAILVARGSRLPGRISVGMASSTASVLGMPFINAMREDHSDVCPHVVESFSGDSGRTINTRQIDLVVTFQREKILRWSAILILEGWLFLIGARALLVDIANDNTAPVQLASIPLVMLSPGHGLRSRLEVICQERVLNAEIATEIDGLVLLTRAVYGGISVTLQPSAVISYLDKETLRVIGVHSLALNRPNFLVSLSDNELTPVGLAARVMLTKVIYQLMEAGSWPGVILCNN